MSNTVPSHFLRFTDFWTVFYAIQLLCSHHSLSLTLPWAQNIDEVGLAEPLRILRSQLRILERLGRGQYGDVHVCHHVTDACSSSSLVAVKSLETNAPRLLR